MAEMNTVVSAPRASEYSGAASGDLAIRVTNLRKQYGAVEAVRGISLGVHKGEIFGLIGPDGAGKTSTFQILAGVMEATSGDVEVLPAPSGPIRPKISPLCTSKLIPRTASTEPYCLRKFVT